MTFSPMSDDLQTTAPKVTIKQQRDLKQEMKEQRRRDAARQEKTKTVITWSIVGLVVVGIVALIIVSGGGSPTSATLSPVVSSDHIRGPVDAKVTIVEYSDFQCPACGAYYPMVKGLESKFGEKIAIVYRNFPLTSLHQYAQLAAQAAEAANLQGKYWEMHDLLFERQDVWSKGSDVKKTFTEYAKELNLNTDQFSKDLNSSVAKDRVGVDVTSGNAIGINATPTFFLNGKKLTNPATQEAFDKLVTDALAA